jgi:hypothetical protein
MTLTERILYHTGRIRDSHKVRVFSFTAGAETDVCVMQVGGKNSIGLNMKSMELEREIGIKLSIHNIDRIPMVRLSLLLNFRTWSSTLSIECFCPSL